jgi:hypothetical protein
MAVSLFLTYFGGADDGPILRDWFRNGPAEILRRAGGITGLEFYAPEASHDPFLDDGEGPLLIAEFGFPDVAALEKTTASEDFQHWLCDLSRLPAADCRVTCEAFEVLASPVAGESEPSPRTAPISYVVRYYRPAGDEEKFIAYYLDHHPALLGEFAGIRNVICYVPVAWANQTGLAESGCMFGNEVVFDTLEDLNAALASEVRQRLRQDYDVFREWTGPNTHFAMTRSRPWDEG